MHDDDLYDRSVRTLLACWDEIALGADGAAVRRLDGVAAAVFPRGPERAFYNNAVLERADALEAMEAAYAAAGVERFAAWAHEREPALRTGLEARGYVLQEVTRVMAMEMDELREPASPAGVEIGPASWDEYLHVLGVPPGLLAGADPSAFHVLVARADGKSVATGMAFDHDGDCGIYNVTTLEHARRRGIGTALTAALARDGAARGCTTASLQSTPVAERVYAALGFRDLGRYLEHVPPVAR